MNGPNESFKPEVHGIELKQEVTAKPSGLADVKIRVTYDLDQDPQDLEMLRTEAIAALKSWHPLSREQAMYMAGDGPNGLQLDLLTALLRLCQINKEQPPAHLLWERVMTCDLPRLASYLDEETITWMKADPGTRPEQAQILAALPSSSFCYSSSPGTSFGPPAAGNAL